MDDWESFIANVEGSAPKVDIDEERHRCQECDTVLENIDGDFICPGCSAQATNILQLEQTEVYCDDSGRVYLGQAVNLHAKRSKRHKTDYGWAWSTDDAIVHILSLQIEALEKLGLVPQNFRPSISNMWFKYWLENVAQFIRDEYDENDLTPFKTTNSLKTRDIEVLIKVRDKVMIPEWACRSRAAKAEAGRKNKRKRTYSMMGTRFRKNRPPEASENVNMNLVEKPEGQSPEQDNRRPGQAHPALSQDDPVSEDDLACPDYVEEDQDIEDGLSRLRPKTNSTRNLRRDSVNILTLNRTLAFIEATARLTQMPEPLFASDIIRSCTQQLIPFYGAQKELPENMKCNYEDRLLFKVTSTPSTNQLTRATSLLIHKVYHDKFPLQAPVPNFATIMQRFIEDMNLPRDILEYVSDVDFSCFGKTKQVLLPENKPPTLQHYDRWAFAILICQLKKIFSLDEESLCLQCTQARNESDKTNEHYFIAHDWLRQLSIRLRLIMSHDPYVLHHPMVNIADLVPTSQMFKHVETTLSHRSQATTRLLDPLMRNDPTFRSELTDFLKHEIPKPRSVMRNNYEDSELEKPTDPRHPLQDSFRRTQNLWISKVESDEILVNLIFKDFSSNKTLPPDHGRRWSIYETSNCDNLKLDISPEWPYFFRLLLHVGGFICFCDPRHLLREVRFVEEYLYSGARASFKRRNIAIRNAKRSNNEATQTVNNND